MNEELRRLLVEPVERIVRNAIAKLIAMNPWVRLGTIPADYTTGLPEVKFDSDDAASGRRYPYVSPYTPIANDRVLLVRCGSTWVILGKVVAS